MRGDDGTDTEAAFWTFAWASTMEATGLNGLLALLSRVWSRPRIFVENMREMLCGDDGAFVVVVVLVVAVLAGRDISGRVRELAPLSDDRCFGIAKSKVKASPSVGDERSCSEWDEVGEGGRGEEQ